MLLQVSIAHSYSRLHLNTCLGPIRQPASTILGYRQVPNGLPLLTYLRQLIKNGGVNYWGSGLGFRLQGLVLFSRMSRGGGQLLETSN